MPKVSVVIPAYNAEAFLNATLRSVLNQSLQDFEIIVVDDGSSDRTRSIVETITDGRIRYIYQENRGQASARNTGLRLAQGEYIACLDADDLWDPEMLKVCVSFLDEHLEIDVVSTECKFIDQNGNLLPARPTWDPWCANILDRLIVNNAFFHISASLIRQKCFESVGLFDEDLRGTEDWEFWIRIAAAGLQFGFISQVLVLYRRHESNTTLHYERMRTNRLVVLNKIFNCSNLKGRIVPLRKKAYSDVFARSCIEAFRSNLIDAALQDFSLALEHNPSLIVDLSFYFQIACISVPIGCVPTSQNVDIVLGQQYLESLKRYIYTLDPKNITSHKQRAIANIYLALGMVSYSYESNLRIAQRHFAKSIRYRPLNWLAWLWLARATIGKKRILYLRLALERGIFRRQPNNYSKVSTS